MVAGAVGPTIVGVDVPGGRRRRLLREADAAAVGRRRRRRRPRGRRLVDLKLALALHCRLLLLLRPGSARALSGAARSRQGLAPANARVHEAVQPVTCDDRDLSHAMSAQGGLGRPEVRLMGWGCRERGETASAWRARPLADGARVWGEPQGPYFRRGGSGRPCCVLCTGERGASSARRTVLPAPLPHPQTLTMVHQVASSKLSAPSAFKACPVGEWVGGLPWSAVRLASRPLQLPSSFVRPSPSPQQPGRPVGRWCAGHRSSRGLWRPAGAHVKSRGAHGTQNRGDGVASQLRRAATAAAAF